MQFQGGLELSLVHVLQACVQVSGAICMVPLENVGQNILLCQWESVHRSPSIVWVLDFSQG